MVLNRHSLAMWLQRKWPHQFTWIDDARVVFKRAKSSQIALIAAFLSALQSGLEFYLTGSGWMALVVAFVAFAAAVARVIQQPKLHEDGTPRDTQ